MNWREEYKKSLKMKEVEEIFDLLVYRPLAFLLVRVIYKTNITPNQLSITAIFMGVVAGCFFSAGIPEYNKIGAFFFMMFNIFDCSDGQLARLKKNGTPVGRIIDGISDYLATLAVFVGIYLGFYKHSPDHIYWLLMLTLAGITCIVNGILVDYYRNRFLDYVLVRVNTSEVDLKMFEKEYESLKYQKGKWLDRLVLVIYFKYSALQRVLVARKKKTQAFLTTSQEYYQMNRIIIRFWLLLGPTTQITTLIICSFFNRFDLFVWIMVAGFNSLAIVLWLIQHAVDRKFKREPG
jgi:phosphatidylglycerophosphate synthase